MGVVTGVIIVCGFSSIFTSTPCPREVRQFATVEECERFIQDDSYFGHPTGGHCDSSDGSTSWVDRNVFIGHHITRTP